MDKDARRARVESGPMSHQTVLIINLFLGLVTIGVAALVIQIWMPPVAIRRHAWGPHEWLLAGITIGFASTIGDNIFWGITWYSKLKEWPTSPWWFDHGPAANLIFRHVGKITAGLCHLEAARQASVVHSGDLVGRSVMMLVAASFLFLWLVL